MSWKNKLGLILLFILGFGLGMLCSRSFFLRTVKEVDTLYIPKEISDSIKIVEIENIVYKEKLKEVEKWRVDSIESIKRLPTSEGVEYLKDKLKEYRDEEKNY
jgi:hypothetical protein